MTCQTKPWDSSLHPSPRLNSQVFSRKLVLAVILLIQAAFSQFAAAAQCLKYRWDIGTAYLGYPDFSTGIEFCEYRRNDYEHQGIFAPNYTGRGVMQMCSYQGQPLSRNDGVTDHVVVQVTYYLSGCDANGQNCYNDQYTGAPFNEAHADAIESTDCGFFVRNEPKQCGSSCNDVGEPINPATGAVLSEENDSSVASSSLQFKRFYESQNPTSNDNISKNWRFNYSRRMKSVSDIPAFLSYSASDPNNSAKFADAATACINGFPQIQARVANWSGATAAYVNGVCVLTKAGANIGTLPIFSASQTLQLPNATIVGYDVTRDDGQLIRFTVQGGQIVAPPSIKLKLQTIGNGYTITDANNDVETYNSSGVLQSIRSRSGVIQTITYDGMGRLSAVTDSFGHRLTFGYDAQNRLTTVTRQ